MKLGRLHSKVAPTPGENAPARRLSEPPVLLALVAIVVGAVWLGMLLAPGTPGEELSEARSPGEDSPEAGFARDMSIHHAQAVRMAEAVRTRTEDPAIQVLATDIDLTQQAEIGQMRGWLEVWGLSSGSSEPMAWMGHGGAGPMPGMATPEELARLQQASPEEADELFLRLMIPHHQAAAEMAEAVLELTDQPEVVRFAQRTAVEQQAEIRGMQALLQRKGLPPEEAGLSMPSMEDHAEESPIEEDPGEGFADAVLPVARDTARLAPLPLAVLAVAWLGFDAVRRRQTWAGDASPPVLWGVLAVGGLSLSAALNIGLAPAYFEEANVYGYLFSGAGIALAAAAAAVWAWPSRLAYLAGATLPLALIALWAVFQLVPPSGAGTAEPLDLMGLITNATELLTVLACAALWLRAPRRHRRKRAGTDAPVDPGRA